MMLAYNEETVIGEAIQSILDQTYEDWELIIVDDGSTDGTPDVVARFEDPRIRYVRQENQGRGAARNAALRASRGQYIAIADADDISLPSRFQKQVAFLEAHPEVGVVSAQLKFFTARHAPTYLFDFPVEKDAIQARFSQGFMGVAHPASMIRRVVFDSIGNYAEECLRAQDLELFLRASDHFSFATLPEVLVLYRNDPGAVSFQKWVSVSLFRHYANYRYRCWQRHVYAKPFSSWQKHPRVWATILTWDVLRFLRQKAQFKLSD